MECMKTSTPTALRLIDKCNINPNDIHTDKSFIDLECVINHLKKSPVLSRTPLSMTYDSSSTFIDIAPKNACRIRPYQKEVLNEIIHIDKSKNTMTVHPTLVVMPCGSGKTITALCCMATCRQKTLIITNYKIVATQWQKELSQNFDIPYGEIQCIADETFNFNHDNPPSICIITYDTLTSSLTSSSRKLLFSLILTSFGLIILDEAHKSVAFSYYCILSKLTGLFLAFTATPIREDSELKLMNNFVNYEFEIKSDYLIQHCYIAKISCTTILVPTDQKLICSKWSHNQKIRGAVVNPNKIAYLRHILEKVTQNKEERILIFCDDIWSLRYVFSKFKHSYKLLGPICMETPLEHREKFVKQFAQEDDEQYKILFISRTGDEGLDIPCASKLIQICTPWGSRRQHAQRVGRIQRAHNSTKTCEAITIVSKDTIEVEFAKKRDKYLKDMKYDMHTIDIAEDDDVFNEYNQNSYDVQELLNSIQKSTTRIKCKKKTKVKNKGKSNLQILKKKLSKKCTRTYS